MVKYLLMVLVKHQLILVGVFCIYIINLIKTSNGMIACFIGTSAIHEHQTHKIWFPFWLSLDTMQLGTQYDHLRITLMKALFPNWVTFIFPLREIVITLRNQIHFLSFPQFPQFTHLLSFMSSAYSKSSTS